MFLIQDKKMLKASITNRFISNFLKGLIALFCTFLSAQQYDGIGWLGIHTNTIKLDKQAHSFVGLSIGATSYIGAFNLSKGHRTKARVYGILVPTVLGVLNELNDKNKGYKFNTNDLLHTFISAVLVTITVDLFFHKKNNRIIKRQKARWDSN